MRKSNTGHPTASFFAPSVRNLPRKRLGGASVRWGLSYHILAAEPHGFEGCLTGMRKDPYNVVFQGPNLISQKEVDAGKRLLESIRNVDLDREFVGLKHVQLAIAYRRKKLIDRSDHLWRKAIEYDHHTGIAYEKLTISLARQGRLDEAIEVCDALIRHPTIPRKGSYLTKEAMKIRRDKLLVRGARIA